MKLRCEKSGFTLVEILTVMGIIVLLTGVLVTAGSVVRRIAKEAKQKAQLVRIELGLLAFRGDYGDYPPSGFAPPNFRIDYSGSQMLAEALLGWDLLGFHPNSGWYSTGLDKDGREFSYDPAKLRGDASLYERVKPYLERGSENAFRVGNSAPGAEDGLFDNTGQLAANTFLICDCFGVRKMIVGGHTARAGTPILYYKANPASKTIVAGFPDQRIYNVLDNDRLVSLGKLTIDGQQGDVHWLGDPAGTYQNFYSYIRDPKVGALPWPYRADSYILISAGADGEYGTPDDITNFGN